jgi:hypothetical protein
MGSSQSNEEPLKNQQVYKIGEEEKGREEEG